MRFKREHIHAFVNHLPDCTIKPCSAVVTDDSDGETTGGDESDDEFLDVEGVSEEDIKVLTGEELLDLFREMCPSIDETGLDKAGRPRRPTVGLVCPEAMPSFVNASRSLSGYCFWRWWLAFWLAYGCGQIFTQYAVTTHIVMLTLCLTVSHSSPVSEQPDEWLVSCTGRLP